MKKNAGKECEPKPEKTSKNCYSLKKHPSATSTKYQGRVCPDPEKFKEKCPAPIEVCKHTTVIDECAVKKKRQTPLTIEDEEIVVIPRGKPPQCPPKDNPCANDNKPVLIEKPKPKDYSCLDED